MNPIAVEVYRASRQLAAEYVRPDDPGRRYLADLVRRARTFLTALAVALLDRLKP